MMTSSEYLIHTELAEEKSLPTIVMDVIICYVTLWDASSSSHTTSSVFKLKNSSLQTIVLSLAQARIRQNYIFHPLKNLF